MHVSNARHMKSPVNGSATRLPKPGSLSIGSLLAILVLIALPASAQIQASGRASDDPGPAWNLLTPDAAGATIYVASAKKDEEVLRALHLQRGKSTLMRTEFRVKRVSVGNPAILDVVVLSPTTLQLVPKKAGGTNLVLWDPSDSPQAAIDVAIATPHDHIQRLLRKVFSTDDIFVESAGEAIVLRGSVPSPTGAERALAVARSFFPDTPKESVVNLLEVGGNQQVMIEVIIAEMDRIMSRKIAVNWSTMIETGAKAFTFTSLLSNLIELTEEADTVLVSPRVNLVGSFVNPGDWRADAFVELANMEGLAKILAQPTLLARSGQSASFLVGGEVPIPIAQNSFGAVSIEFKEFGVGMNFTPTVLGPNRIYLEVSPEVSDIDPSLTTNVGGVLTPGFRTRRASTTVELGDGQSFAIAGLLRDDVIQSNEYYPILGRIPVLGALFRSARFQRNETEMVLIVTANLVKPLPPGPHPLPTDSFIEPGEAEFYLLGRLESGSGTGHEAEAPPPASPAPEELIGPTGHRVPADVERNSQ
jgi:pilus assembly protein CpaC